MSAARDTSLVKLDFLQPLVHYVSPIFAARTHSDHSAALAAVQGYLDVVLAENQAAARKLAAEKARILQICQAPQYEGRYCRLLCEDLNPSEAARTPGHHVILLELDTALKELSVEENLINLWRLAFSHPLHCLSQRPTYQVVYASDQPANGENRRIVATPQVASASTTTSSSAPKHNPVNLVKKGPPTQ